MTLIIDGHSFHYEMENLCRIFLPYEKIKVTTELCEDEFLAYTQVKEESNGWQFTARLQFAQERYAASQWIPIEKQPDETEIKRSLAVLLFQLLVKHCGFTPKWGVLIGVRPIKLLRGIISTMGEEKGLDYFQSKLLVSPEKTELSYLTMRREEKILALSKPESFSLYISIPFCPTRCAYCSFVSSSVEKTVKLIPNYLHLLCREIEHTAKVAEELGLRLESVYVGGGTPTTLTAKQLELLLDTVRRSFDLAICREFTVEAGRPDTIHPDKLQAMMSRSVTRISINPQTLNDEVLHNIGRHHTTEQTLSAFSMARDFGFGNINMDLIAGLPGDSVKSFQDTLDHVIRLSPESITVHTLALKRSARIFQEGNAEHHDAKAASEMLDYAGTELLKNGYAPYYLYRQSRMVGNLENTGWAKPGFESLYNAFIMDETHSVLACGAGATSIIRDPYSERLERIFNFKYPYEYISRFEEMIIRKDQVKDIYDKFRRISE